MPLVSACLPVEDTSHIFAAHAADLFQSQIFSKTEQGLFHHRCNHTSSVAGVSQAKAPGGIV
jgi:hypothetical protein